MVGPGEKRTPFPFLHATFRVGSCRGSLNSISFSKDDVPPKAKARHDEVLEWKRRPTLPAGRKSSWNLSVQPAAYPPRQDRTNLQGGPSCLYKHNYRAEVIPRAPPPLNPRLNKFDVSVMEPGSTTAPPPSCGARPYSMMEMPVHPSLEGKRPWDACAVLTPSQKRAHYSALVSRSRAATARRAATASAPQPTLVERFTRQLAATRDLKSAGGFTTAAPLPDRDVFGPGRQADATAAAAAAAAQAAARCGAGELSAAQRHRREQCVRRHVHSGAWEYRESEGRHMWSDTGSYERESPGDVIKVWDPYAMNLASPCLH